MIPANTNQAIDAVARLLAEAESAAPAPANGVEKRIAELEKRGRKLTASFRQVAASANATERGRLIRTIREMEQNLERVELELRSCGARRVVTASPVPRGDSGRAPRPYR